MGDATVGLDEVPHDVRDRLVLRTPSRFAVTGAAVLAVSAVSAGLLATSLSIGSWFVAAHDDMDLTVATPPAVAHRTSFSPRFDVALLDPAYSLGPEPVALALSVPLGSNLVPTPTPPAARNAEQQAATPDPVPEAVIVASSSAPTATPFEAVPLPTPRPADAPATAGRIISRPIGRQVAQQSHGSVAPAAGERETFIEKFFGLLKPSGPVLAYASPEDGLFGRSRGFTADPEMPRDRWTAVYDIAAHTVYMPNGERLEAHSGLGDRLDDPHHVNEQNRGATPPHLYDLELRAELFHGVRALRLNPVGGGGVFGRTGLLAHTFMLGPHGDSNGCVSFRDYDAFLQAYLNGQIRRLAVVARSA